MSQPQLRILGWAGARRGGANLNQAVQNWAGLVGCTYDRTFTERNAVNARERAAIVGFLLEWGETISLKLQPK